MQDLNAFQRFLLALRCFFLVLFARRLPEEATAFLPAPAPAAPSEPAALPAPTPVPVPAPVPAPAPAQTAPPVDKERLAEAGAVRLLALLQREGRLIDFLEEEIESYEDAQIGAAVRDIHRGCRKALGEYLQLKPVLPQPESSSVRVEAGFDTSTIRLVGDVVGQPPFTGTLRHPGWRAQNVRLPATPDGHDPTVVAPAEVELGGLG
ncbi:MAG TPA: DUF2760 domain-containing protein [Polyangia bacterium]|jgi:hypothetical protein|nr:DUF2760 domain-containing protein [Polyangia bacterium]